jgi:hypothetical protein
MKMPKKAAGKSKGTSMPMKGMPMKGSTKAPKGGGKSAAMKRFAAGKMEC